MTERNRNLVSIVLMAPKSNGFVSRSQRKSGGRNTVLARTARSLRVSGDRRKWRGGDLNPQPPGYEPGELPIAPPRDTTACGGAPVASRYGVMPLVRRGEPDWATRNAAPRAGENGRMKKARRSGLGGVAVWTCQFCADALRSCFNSAIVHAPLLGWAGTWQVPPQMPHVLLLIPISRSASSI